MGFGKILRGFEGPGGLRDGPRRRFHSVFVVLMRFWNVFGSSDKVWNGFRKLSKEFKRFVNKLIKKKFLKKWNGKHIYLNTKKKENKKHIKIIGKNGNNDICKYLLRDIKCFYQSEPSDEILNCEYEGILGPVAGIVGNIQAIEVLKKILNLSKESNNKILILDLLNLNFRKVQFNKKKSCICKNF